jgi:non-specific serine/threonine protein kinase/serine/threonine-protein kinase
MGVVYRARRADDQYRQVVAIKVIRNGMETARGQRRFREERQILAGLEHPGIARLLDGGTTEEGRPYLVMEHAEGEPVDTWCDRRRVGVEERLRLFLEVCAAVHHAHRNLVVHRDLKPANILVNAEGRPKLLDFGIAKMLHPDGSPVVGEATVTALRMLTPDYASPEQIRGERVTTATDVYSLGVLLYELLSGHRPYRYRAGWAHELLAAICDQDPERPSAVVAQTETRCTGATTVEVTPRTVAEARDLTPRLLRKRLRGDLDTIALKALRKAPADRYASAEAFADDVRRHLDGRPVWARPQTFAYRSAKFVRRNPWSVTAASVAIFSLLAGIATAAKEARLADAQRQRAERRFAQVRRLAGTLLFELHDAIAPLAGAMPARALVVQRALEYLDSLSSEAAGDRSLQRELAEAYKRVGDVQGGMFMANLGDTAGALASYQKAIALYETARGPEDSDRQPLAEAHRALAVAQAGAGDTAAALRNAEQAVALSRAMIVNGRTSPTNRRELALDLQAVGFAAFHGGDLPRAEAALREGIGLLEALHALEPRDHGITSPLAGGRWQLAGTLWIRGDSKGADEEYERAQALQEALARAAPENAHYKRQLAYTLTSRGSLIGRDFARAEPILRRAVELWREMAQADPQNMDAQMNLASAQKNLGQALAVFGARPAEARILIEEALAFAEKASAADPAHTQIRVLLAECFESRAEVEKAEAGRARTPARRLTARREEGASLRRARDIYLGLRAARRLSGFAERSLQEVEAALAACEAEIPPERGRAAGAGSTKVAAR